MDVRLNLGSKVKELKLGSTFSNSNSKSATAFHTLKYDFKPASVDLSKVATLDVSSNNQVTVTVPHLESSGVPKTVFKGNQRNCTKECVLIIDKVTGEITLEKLSHNIQVKKTRSENTHKPSMAPHPPPRASLENSTQRTVSKTKVSTGIRKNALAGIVQRNSPIQGSPSYQHHKSPQQAPAWNANNNQSTLPSIPIIGMDDDVPEPQSYNQQHQQQQQQQQQQHQQLHSHHQQQQQQQHYQQSHHNSHGHSYGHNMNNIPMSSGVSSGNNHQLSSSGGSGGHNNSHQQQHQQQQQQQQLTQPQHLGDDVALLTTSDSSSDSDSSGSGSDSDDDTTATPAVGPVSAKPVTKNHNHNHHHHNNNHSNNHSSHNRNNMDHNALLLNEDLRLSESNSSDSDD